MNIKKMQGKTVQDAVKKATILYGDDISIVETKTIKSGLFGTASTYEVIISIPENIQDEWQDNRKSRFQNQIENRMKKDFDLRIDTSVEPNNNQTDSIDFQPSKKVNSSDNYLLSEKEDNQFINVSENARKIAELTKTRQEEHKKNRESNSSPVKQVNKQKIVSPPKKSNTLPLDTIAVNDLKSEMSQLNDKIKLIQNMFWKEKGPEKSTIPPEFSEIYRIAKQSGMNEEHLEMIMKLSIEHMPFKMRQSSQTVKRYFTALLQKMIPIRAETFVKPPNKKIIMLIGSTGVGKTTTIAKLTARFALKSDIEYKVGLLVLDTYKIGAVEQLSQYARMMKVQIETVVSPVDFADKLDRMTHNDYIFIDTMGSSPYDVGKIENIKDFLDSGNHSHEIEVMLVLPSSLKYEDLKEGYNSFSKLNIDTIMFTKLDETKGFGNIFSLIHDIQKPISYFSIGQEVPEDIIVARSDYLVDSLLHGFKRKEGK